MRGAFERIKEIWPDKIEHNHRSDVEKALRYQVGEERLELLRKNSQRFAYKAGGETEELAYLFEVEEGDLDYRMPENTRYEYLCARSDSEGVILFSYIWFSKLSDAKNYVKKHGMKIEGGWNDKKN